MPGSPARPGCFFFAKRVKTQFPRTNPAIVTEQAAQTLPRVALIGLALVYCLAGLIDREPFKPLEIVQLGWVFILTQAHPATDLLNHPGFDQLLFPAGFTQLIALPLKHLTADAAFFVYRCASALILMGTLLMTWLAARRFASLTSAQPVSFAFGGEAKPGSYATTIADSSVLALIASLGFSQFGHEFSSFLALIFCVSLLMLSTAYIQGNGLARLASRLIPLLMMAFIGAPLLAIVMAVMLVLQSALSRSAGKRSKEFLLHLILMLVVIAIVLTLSYDDLMQLLYGRQSHGLVKASQLLIWFTWPIWPMVLWTMWKWRSHWWSRNASVHLLSPILMSLGTLIHALFLGLNDRWYFLSLPALSLLAAMALPTLTRSVSSIIDWFTMLLFTGSGVLIWLFWLAGLTGWPIVISHRLQQLIPEFNLQFHFFQFLIALLASVGWLWLVHWRTGRHREALWKSLALPAGGAATCWVLLTTLWLPYLNQSRSMAELGVQAASSMPDHQCAYDWNLSAEQISSLLYYGAVHRIESTLVMDQNDTCSLLIANRNGLNNNESAIDAAVWVKDKTLAGSLTSTDDDVVIFRRR